MKPDDWVRNTPERFIFDHLVRRANEAVVEHWERILEIIAENMDNSKDYELRMDMLALVEFFLNNS